MGKRNVFFFLHLGQPIISFLNKVMKQSPDIFTITSNFVSELPWMGSAGGGRFSPGIYCLDSNRRPLKTFRHF